MQPIFSNIFGIIILNVNLIGIVNIKIHSYIPLLQNFVEISPKMVSSAKKVFWSDQFYERKKNINSKTDFQMVTRKFQIAEI